MEFLWVYLPKATWATVAILLYIVFVGVLGTCIRATNPVVEEDQA